jgi:hypothetical protein
METPLLPVKGCKIRPVLGICIMLHLLRYRTSVSGLIRRTDPFSHLSRQAINIRGTEYLLRRPVSPRVLLILIEYWGWISVSLLWRFARDMGTDVNYFMCMYFSFLFLKMDKKLYRKTGGIGLVYKVLNLTFLHLNFLLLVDFTFRSRISHLYGDVTVVSEGLAVWMYHYQ